MAKPLTLLPAFPFAMIPHPISNNDDAALRWNTCVRLLQANPHIRPRRDELAEPTEFDDEVPGLRE